MKKYLPIQNTIFDFRCVMKLTVLFKDDTVIEYDNIDHFNYSSLDNDSLTFHIKGCLYEIYFIDVRSFDIS